MLLGHVKDTISPTEYVCFKGEVMTWFESGGASHEVPGAQHKDYMGIFEHFIFLQKLPVFGEN